VRRRRDHRRRLRVDTRDFRFHVASAGKAIAITIFLVAVAWFYRTKRPMEEFEVLCTETSLLLAFSAATAVLTYLVTSINFPLIDDRLIEIDTFLGFDRLAYVGFVSERPLLGTLSTAVYATTLAQVALVVVLLGTIGKLERARRFASAVGECRLVKEKPKQNNNRYRNTEQPKNNSAKHLFLLSFCEEETQPG